MMEMVAYYQELSSYITTICSEVASCCQAEEAIHLQKRTAGIAGTDSKTADGSEAACPLIPLFIEESQTVWHPEENMQPFQETFL